MKYILKVLFLAPVLFFSNGIIAQTQPAVLDAKQVADRAKPGVVIVQSEFKATVSVPLYVVNQYAVNALLMEINNRVAQGLMPRETAFDVFLDTYLQNLGTYLYPNGQRITKEVKINPVGSDFIISMFGYVATNCHVVDENNETLQSQLALMAMKEYIEQDIEQIRQSMPNLTEEQEEKIRMADASLFAENMLVSNVNKSYSIIYNIGLGQKVIYKTVPAQLVIKGAPIPGKDVAILKAQAANLPTVAIGDDKPLRAGDKIFVMGYPDAATYHTLLSLETLSEATLTQGIISARKNMKDGWEVLQIDAAITHGNSGGPVFNEKGEVIGLATFGSISFTTGQEVQGMNFAVPVTILKEFLLQANVQPTMNYASKVFAQGLDEYDRNYYKKALKKFDEVKQNCLTFPYIDYYIEESKKAIAEGRSKEPNYILPVALGGGAALAAILVVIAVRRKKRMA